MQIPLVSQDGPRLLVRDVKQDSYGERQTANCKLQTAVMTQSNAVTRPQCKNTMRNAVSGNQIALPTGGGGGGGKRQKRVL